MENVNDWETKAEKTLNSLDGMERASANPFLYTRVRAKFAENKTVWSKAANLIAKPVVAFSLVACFVGVNTLAIIQQPGHKPVARPVQESEQAFDQDYATVNYSLGELNTNEK